MLKSKNKLHEYNYSSPIFKYDFIPKAIQIHKKRL